MNRMLNKPPRYSGQHTILESLSSVSVCEARPFSTQSTVGAYLGTASSGSQPFHAELVL
jgi:hypothetical protein